MLGMQNNYRVMNPMNNPISWPTLNDIGKLYLALIKVFTNY